MDTPAYAAHPAFHPTHQVQAPYVNGYAMRPQYPTVMYVPSLDADIAHLYAYEHTLRGAVENAQAQHGLFGPTTPLARSPGLHLTAARHLLSLIPVHYGRELASYQSAHMYLTLAQTSLNAAAHLVREAAHATMHQLDTMHAEVQTRRSELPRHRGNAKTPDQVGKWLDTFGNVGAKARRVHAAPDTAAAIASTRAMAASIPALKRPASYGFNNTYLEKLVTTLQETRKTRNTAPPLSRVQSAKELSDIAAKTPALHSAFAYTSHKFAGDIIGSVRSEFQPFAYAVTTL